MPPSRIENLIPNLQSSDLLLQHLFILSKGRISPHAYLDFVNHHIPVLMDESDFFQMAAQGLLLTAKSKKFTRLEEESILKQKGDDFGVVDAEEFDQIEKYLDMAYMFLEREEPEVEFSAEPDEPDEPKIDYKSELFKLALNEQEAKEAVFSFRLAVSTLGFLYRKGEVSYRSLSKFAPISQDPKLYTTRADWKLHSTPKHTYFRLKKLGQRHKQAKRSIAAGDQLDNEQIKELFKLGHFLAAIHTLTKSITSKKM